MCFDTFIEPVMLWLHEAVDDLLASSTEFAVIQPQ